MLWISGQTGGHSQGPASDGGPRDRKLTVSPPCWTTRDQGVWELSWFGCYPGWWCGGVSTRIRKGGRQPAQPHSSPSPCGCCLGKTMMSSNMGLGEVKFTKRGGFWYCFCITRAAFCVKKEIVFWCAEMGSGYIVSYLFLGLATTAVLSMKFLLLFYFIILSVTFFFPFLNLLLQTFLHPQLIPSVAEDKVSWPFPIFLPSL